MDGETEDRVRLGDADLFTLRVGGGAEMLVLLHGGPGASHDYLRPQMDALARPGRTLVYYDQRGGGRSSAQPGTAVEHVADLEALRQQLGIERLRLVGYSFGAILALLYARAHPARIERLALVSPGPTSPHFRQQMQRRFKEMAERPEVTALRARLDPSDRRHRFALAVAGYFVNPERALELTPFVVRHNAEQAVWHSLGDADLSRAVPRGLPALVVCGKEDPIPVENAAQLAATLGCPFVALEGCGHVPYIEAPDALFAALEQFLG